MAHKKMYLLRCVATSQGTTLERRVKTYCWEFNNVLVSEEGWWTVFRMIQQAAKEFKEKHPACELPQIEYYKQLSDIRIHPKNPNGNFELLQCTVIKRYYCGENEQLVIRNNNENVEDL